MSKFGYTPLNSKTIALEATEPTQWQKLLQKYPEFSGCMACGACGGVCPRNATHGLSVHKMVLELRRGVTPSMLAQDCLMCNKCALVCPRNLSTRLVWFTPIHPED